MHVGHVFASLLALANGLYGDSSGYGSWTPFVLASTWVGRFAIYRGYRQAV